MKAIYLDYNILIYLMEGSNAPLSQAVADLKNTGSVIFPYSPAHIEEISVAQLFGSATDQQISHKLDFVRQLTGSIELLPSRGQSTVTKTEDPKKCYERVVASSNDLAHAIAEHKRKKAALESEGVFDAVHTSGINEDRLFHNPAILSALDTFASKSVKPKEFLTRTKFQSLRKNHALLEISIELLFDFLDYIRFSPENIEEYRSRMHDISHAIYATTCDFFVTNDRKFYRRAKSVYNFLQIRTKVLTAKEFLSYDFSTLQQ